MPLEQPGSNDKRGQVAPLYPLIPAPDTGVTQAAVQADEEAPQLDKTLYPLRIQRTSEC